MQVQKQFRNCRFIPIGRDVDGVVHSFSKRVVRGLGIATCVLSRQNDILLHSHPFNKLPTTSFGLPFYGQEITYEF